MLKGTDTPIVRKFLFFFSEKDRVSIMHFAQIAFARVCLLSFHALRNALLCVITVPCESIQPPLPHPNKNLFTFQVVVQQNRGKHGGCEYLCKAL